MNHYKNYSLENIEGEIWKDIPKWEGMYMISNKGRIKSLSRLTPNGRLLKEKIFKQQNRNRYLNGAFSLNGRHKNNSVHRMVANVFIPHIVGKNFINHKDGDRKNNDVENLEWCTESENMQHAIRTKLWTNHRSAKGEENPKSKLIIDLQTGIFYFGTTEASIVKGIDRVCLWKYLSGKLKNKTSLRLA